LNSEKRIESKKKFQGERQKTQPEFIFILDINRCVPANHPLRIIKSQVDAVLKKLSPLFNEFYEELGRPSIPPEQLLKSRILMVLHSVRSKRLFCEQPGYNLLWLWFLDRDPNEGIWMDYDSRRPTAKPVSRVGADTSVGIFCSSCIQSIMDGTFEFGSI